MTNKENNQLAERQQALKRMNSTIGTPDVWVKYLSHLTFKEQYIIQAYWGLNGFKQRTFEELADEIKTSLGSVVTYYNSACRKISILQNEQANPKYQYLFMYSNQLVTPDNYTEMMNLSRKEKIKVVHSIALQNAEEGLEMVKSNPKLLTDNLKFFNENERYTLLHLLGLDGNEKLTPEQILADLNISAHYFVSLKLNSIKKLMRLENLIAETGSTEGFAGTRYKVEQGGGMEDEVEGRRDGRGKVSKLAHRVEHLTQDLDWLNKNLTHLSIGEQYVFLRLSGINGFEKKPPRQVAEELNVERATPTGYATSAVRKLSILAGEMGTQSDVDKLLKHNSPVLTKENYTQYVGLSSSDKYAAGVSREKHPQKSLEEEQARCEQFRQIAYEENAEFVQLLDQVLDGKDYKLSALLRMVESNKRLTSNQQNYLFSLYNIERLSSKDEANSSVLAVLIMGNQNLINHMLSTRFGSANSYRREKLQMCLQDALRRAIDGYSLDCGTTFSTFAYKTFNNATSTEPKEIIPISLDATTLGYDDDLDLYSMLGDEDEYIADFAEQDYKGRIWSLLGYLPRKSQFIIMAYYGKYCQPMVLSELGSVLHITKSRVAQILTQSLNILRTMIESPDGVRAIKPQQLQDRYRLLTEEEFNAVLSASVQCAR